MIDWRAFATCFSCLPSILLEASALMGNGAGSERYLVPVHEVPCAGQIPIHVNVEVNFGRTMPAQCATK